ncbi:MAG: hypothetical protein PHT75_02635, partial [Bacilli bacterium]|nr:hypothetical protein [Bacilli bacterium]
MKEKWDKLKELSKNKYARPLIFFGFYFIFFSVILSIASQSMPNDNKQVERDLWADITNNYEYLYKVKTEDNWVIKLEGKKYHNKELFTRKINDVLDSEIYIFYEEVSVKKDEKWIASPDFVLIDDSFDEQYFNIASLKMLIADSEQYDSVDNFDGSKSDIYKFHNIDIEVISEDDV